MKEEVTILVLRMVDDVSMGRWWRSWNRYYIK